MIIICHSVSTFIVEKNIIAVKNRVSVKILKYSRYSQRQIRFAVAKVFHINHIACRHIHLFCSRTRDDDSVLDVKILDVTSNNVKINDIYN